MQYLRVMHRDIKNSNIFLHFPKKEKVDMNYLANCDLITERVEVKIGDFGFAKHYNESEDSTT